MVHCVHCGTDNPEGSKVCRHCGAFLQPLTVVICPNCGIGNPVENAFCTNCGARLLPVSAAPLPPTEPPAQPAEASPQTVISSTPPAVETAPGTAPAVQRETTDWIQKLRQETPVEEKPSVPPAVPAGEPAHPAEDWIERLRASEPPEGTTPVPAPSEPSPDLEKPVETAERTGQPATQAPVPTAPPSATTPGAAPASNELGPTDEIAVEELPDWLRVPQPTAAAAEPVEETLAKQEQFPDWVAALRPAEAMPAPLAGETKGEPMESTGPLAGLRGVLPLAAAITQPHGKSQPAKAQVKSSGRLFDSILAETFPTGELPDRKTIKTVRTMRPLIYLLLALAVIVPFALPPGLTGTFIPISNTPAAEFYDVVQALPAESIVLVAFDYDASMTGEMDVQANAVLGDLVRRRAKIVAVSTLDTGPQVAQRVLSATAAASGYRYGADYLNLGYLPGHEAGLASLAATGLPWTQKDYIQNQNLAAYPLAANIKGLSDIQLIVEFSGSEDALKMWMEQVQPRADVPIAAGVSAAVEPRARAYRNARQLVALLGGLMGAAQYEILSRQPGLAVISANAQSAAQAILVIIVIMGNIAYWIQRARGQAV